MVVTEEAADDDVDLELDEAAIERRERREEESRRGNDSNATMCLVLALVSLIFWPTCIMALICGWNVRGGVRDAGMALAWFMFLTPIAMTLLVLGFWLTVAGFR